MLSEFNTIYPKKCFFRHYTVRIQKGVKLCSVTLEKQHSVKVVPPELKGLPHFDYMASNPVLDKQAFLRIFFIDFRHNL